MNVPRVSDERGPTSATLAVALGGGVVVWALGELLRSWTGTDEVAPLVLSSDGLLLGVLASVPTLLLLVYLLRSRFPPFVRIAATVEATLGPTLLRVGLPGVLWISALAGLGEELLFRGWLQVWLVELGLPTWGGVATAAIVFGLLHWVDRWYAGIVLGVGLYYGVLLVWTGDLLVPVVAHAVHDVVALGVVLRRVRRRSEPPTG